MVWKIFTHDSILVNIIRTSKAKKDGDFYSFFPDGRLSQKSHYRKDKLDGVLISYYTSGKILNNGAYVKGKYQGTINEYWCNGNLAHRTTIVADHHIYEFWDDKGNIIEKETFFRLWFN